MITVLLIDDDEDEFILLSEALHKLNKSLNCIYANSAASGLKILKTFRPTYIYVDLNMPITSGLECITLIRNLKGYGKTPIVLYSIAISDVQWLEAKELGATSYLQKTSNIITLVENILIFFLTFNRLLFN